MERGDLLKPFERMLAKLFPPNRVRELERGATWDAELAEIEESGFLDVLAPEANGGAGLGLDYAVPLFAALGRHAAPTEIGAAIIERAQAGAEATSGMRAVLLAAAISGAAERVMEMSAAYANERTQFGKAIGRQQAVQQQLAVMAEDCIAVRLAVELAAANFPGAASLKAAVAKSIASQVGARIANTAHAVHGAIGMSEEYDLQLFTRRLYRWRLQDGSETYWNAMIGEAALADDLGAVDWVRSRVFLESAHPAE